MEKKRRKNLVKGDVIRVELGDYGRWTTVVVDSVEDEGGYYGCCITAHYPGQEKTFEMYGWAESLMQVIGKEE